MKTPVRSLGATAVLATLAHLTFHPTYATAVTPPKPGEVDQIDAVAALEQLWAEQAQWIYDTGYQGHDTFQSIQDAYLMADAKNYARLTRQELEVARYLVSEECAVRQAELTDYVLDSGADGLEGLILTYHDCTAQSGKPTVRAIARLNTAQLQDHLWFAKEPHPNVHIRFAQRNLTVERAVLGEAARATVGVLLADPPDQIAHRSMASILDDPFLQDELCALPPRTMPDGGFSPAALLTMASCNATGGPGGPGSIEDMCQQLTDEASGETESTPLTDSLIGGGATKDELGFLADYCDNRSTGGGLPGSGGALDGFTEDACMPEGSDDLAPYGVDMMDKLEECLGTGSNDPNGPGGLMMGPGEVIVHVIVHVVFELIYENLVGEDIDYINEAADAGCYGAGVKCENDANGHPVCVENCPGDGGTTTTGGDTTSGDTTSGDTTSGDTTTGGDTDSTTSNDTTSGGATGGTGGTGSSGSDAGMPGMDGGGYDPSNPACEDLFGMGVLTPEGWVDGDAFWDSIFGRKPGEDPRKTYPNPDDPPEDVEGNECGPLGGGGYTPGGGGCKLPVTCPMGSAMGDDCCGPTYDGAIPMFDGCINVVCPPDSTMATAGGFDCMCTSGAEGDGEVGPLPQPPFSGSVGVMGLDHGLVVEHMTNIMYGYSDPGAEPGFFGN